MADYIYSLILLIIALIAIELRKSYHAVPKNELRYRARNGDELANRIYRAVSYQESLDILLWLVIILSTTGSLILINRVAPIWLDFIAILLFLWLAFALLPRTRVNSFGSKLAVLLSPAIVWLLNYLHPLFENIYNLLTSSKPKHTHTGIYDQNDLSQLLEKQQAQPDSRINARDLELIKKCLNLSDKKVSEYARNWSKVYKVKENESIGPVLLDELHKSGQHFVPVVAQDEPKKVVGVVDTRKLQVSSLGLIRDHMDEHEYFLNEDDSLADALTAMSKANHPVYIVKDKHDKLRGLITLKDIVSELVSLEDEQIAEDPQNIEDSESQPAQIA